LLGLGAEFWRYFLVSLLALGVDFGGLVLLKEGFHLYYLAASAISYMSGAVVQYGLSVAFVFREHRMANRTAEFIAFTLLGLLGLAATQAVLWLLVGHAHVGYIFAKVIAVGASFVLNYTARRLVLFTHGQAK
jgi:putative flippase GtrA